MANRSGSKSTSDVGRLQEARSALEARLGFPVAASISDRGLQLIVTPPAGFAGDLPASFAGFPVSRWSRPVEEQ